MILDVSKIMRSPDEIMELSFEESISSIKSKFGTIKLIKPIKFTGTITKSKKILLLSGDLSTVLELHCDRCTKPVETPLSIKIDERLSSESIDEEEVYMFSGSEIDLEPIFIEAILLEIPMKVVCSKDCKGICSICGQNLNEHLCDCEKEEMNSSFAVLKNLFDDSK